MTGPRDMIRGDGVTVSWKGTLRTALVVGPAYADGLPTGAHFCPLMFDDDPTETVYNVDTRVIYGTTGVIA